MRSCYAYRAKNAEKRTEEMKRHYPLSTGARLLKFTLTVRHSEVTGKQRNVNETIRLKRNGMHDTEALVPL
jgi:hypothetical protein